MNIVLMGVAGCGKTTLGKYLAKQLHRPFHDGDDYHPAANVARMAAGIPLDDVDRIGWLSRLHRLLVEAERTERRIVLACSALKESYRRRLAGESRVLFVLIDVPRDIAFQRLQSRTDHFMPASMVESQFEALEIPEDALVIDNRGPLEDAEHMLMQRVRPLLQDH